MISLLRRKLLNQRLMKVMIWLTVFALGGFGFVFTLFRRAARQQSNVFIEAGGYEITQADLRRKVDEEVQKVNMIKQQFGPSAEIVLRMYGLTGSPEERAKKALIRQKLLSGVADSESLKLSDEYIAKKMTDSAFVMRIMSDFIPYRFATASGINYKDLFAMLQRRGISAYCFEKVLEERVKAATVESLVSAGTYVPRDVLQEYYDGAYRRRKFSILKVPLDSYITNAQNRSVDETVLKNFFVESNKNHRAYWQPEKRSGVVWTFNAPSGDFKKEADNILLQYGQPFDTFVKKFGGVRQPVGPVELNGDRIVRKLFELKQGGRGVIIENKNGLIVELQHIDPRIEQPFESVKKKVRADYDRLTASNEATKDLEAFKRADSAVRKNLSAKLNARLTTTDFISPQNRENWQALQKEKLPIGKLVSLSHVGQSATAVDDKYGYFMELTEFEPLDVKDFDAKRFELLHALDAEENAQTEAAFVASLEKNAKITEGNKSKRRVL